MAPGSDTSKKHAQNKIYPYRLRGLSIIRVNQVWSTDITYIRLAQGFVYLGVCRTFRQNQPDLTLLNIGDFL